MRHSIVNHDDTSKQKVYNPFNNTTVTKSLNIIRSRLSSILHQQNEPTSNSIQSLQLSSLRVHSMKQSYSPELITQYYQDHMVPFFPLEEERDELDDWIYLFEGEGATAAHNVDDNSETAETTTTLPLQGPTMDIILLLCDFNADLSKSGEDIIIIAGVVFEYYQHAQLGLISYMTCHTNYRRNGIMKQLHPLAIEALEYLHNMFSQQNHIRNGQKKQQQDHTLSYHGKIRAVFAETNTIDASDASEEEIINRHKALYSLGYRLLDFPYIQPPLGTEKNSFDDIMLLVYKDQGNSENNGDVLSSSISSDIPFDYVVDFFKSVFGFEDEAYKNHWYYKLSKWFKKTHPITTIRRDLQWNSSLQKYQQEYEQSQKKYDYIENINEKKESLIDLDKQETHVVIVIGAGVSGLSAAIELAKNTTKPLTVKIIEAHSFVGGRVRTALTNNSNNSDNQYTSKELAKTYQKFHPWPVPLGAEFVHGTDSIVNDIIENNDWEVEETFNFCTVEEEYPSKNNSFISRRLASSLTTKQRNNTNTVKIFRGGKCWDLRGNDNHINHNMMTSSLQAAIQQQHYGRLISKALSIWGELCDLGENFLMTEGQDIPKDKPLSEFIEEIMTGDDEQFSLKDIDTVKSIIDALYAKTAGTSISKYGVNEASREENNWDYTESNFRTNKCFAELIKYYMDEINDVNRKNMIGECKGCIELITSTPITKISKNKRNINFLSNSISINEEDYNRKVLLTSSSNGDNEESTIHQHFTCDKVIVTIPLSILKSGMLKFMDEYSLPLEKREAIERVNMFSGMKAHVLLRKDVDIQKSCSSLNLLEYTDLFFCPGEIFVQVWLRRDENSVFVTGFVVDDGRDELLSRMKEEGRREKNDYKDWCESEHKSDSSKGYETAKKIFLDQLQRMFLNSDGSSLFIDDIIPTCSAFHLYDWSDDEFVGGLYSSPSIGAGWKSSRISSSNDNEPADVITTDREYLRMPIRNTVFFAGEHTNTKTCATVQAAIESGIHVASSVLSVL